MSSNLQAIKDKSLVWLIGAVVCLLIALRSQLFPDAGNRWLHSALRYH